MCHTSTAVLRSRAAWPLMCIVAALALSLVIAGPVLSQELQPIPGAAEQAEAKKLVDEVYGDLINASSNDDKAAAARVLIMRAAETGSVQGAKYIMYDMARSLAVEAGQTQAAMNAIDGLAASFADPSGAFLEMAISSLQDLSRKARSDRDHGEVAQAGLAVAERLVAADRYEDAFTLLTRLKSSALRSKRPELSSAYKEMPKELRIISAEAERISDDLTKFKQNPEDPKLSLTAGRFTALYRGDWTAGLPMLARSSDAALAAAAKADLAGAREPKAQRAIGDRWWELASAGSGVENRRLQERASHWYRLALPETFGIERSLLTKRLAIEGQVKWGDLVLEPGIRTMIQADNDVAGAQPGPIAREAQWEFRDNPSQAGNKVTLYFEGYLYYPRTEAVGLKAVTRSASIVINVNGKKSLSGWSNIEVPIKLVKGYNFFSGVIEAQAALINSPDQYPIARINLTELDGKVITIPAEYWFHDVTR